MQARGQIVRRWTKAADTLGQGSSSIPALLDILTKTVAARRPAPPADTGEKYGKCDKHIITRETAA